MGRMFGTNGVRGVVNETMTVQLALQMGKAIGKVLPGTAAIAMDTRMSGLMLKEAVCAGLMSVGCDVVFLGMMPTPALQYYVKTHDCGCGVMITASHNPPEFNGIKVIAPDGTEASKEQEGAIEDAYDTQIPEVPGTQVGTCREVPGADDAYVDAVAAKVDASEIRRAGLTVVLDCANGASFHTSPELMRRLGVRAITINGNPQGEFPGHHSEPTEEHLSDLKRMVAETGANLGIAHDGDADRCVFVDERGRYVSGDAALAIFGLLAVERAGGEVVTPVATSSVVKAAVEKAGGTLVTTAVGSPVVARRMMDDGAVFGGEGNGGLIFPDFQYCRDGAMAAARMLEIVAEQGPLGAMVDALPVYHMVKRKVACPDDRKQDVLAYVEAAVDEEKDTTDGLKIVTPKGWVLMRPSGTEPIFRVYAESEDEAVANELADTYLKMVEEFLEPTVGERLRELAPIRRSQTIGGYGLHGSARRIIFY